MSEKETLFILSSFGTSQTLNPGLSRDIALGTLHKDCHSAIAEWDNPKIYFLTKQCEASSSYMRLLLFPGPSLA